MRWNLLAAGLLCLSAAAFFTWSGFRVWSGSSQTQQLQTAGHRVETACGQEEEPQESAAEPAREDFSFCRLDNEVKKRITGISYTPNEHISLDELRYVKIKYYGFDGKVKDGELIVNHQIAEDITEIFYNLYCHKYPLQDVSLVEKYGGDDDRSMAANNTSCFNYRVIAGTDKLSNHAYGLAIDINPRINPYIRQGETADTVYAQRDVKKCRGKYRKYMIQKDDYIYRLFQKYGFSWGGDWSSVKDYQHFEKPQLAD